MVSACLEAFRATQDHAWSREAKRAFEWFLGRNDLGLPLYDSGTAVAATACTRTGSARTRGPNRPSPSTSPWPR